MSPTDAINEVIFGLTEQAHDLAAAAAKPGPGEHRRAEKLRQLGEDISALATALKIMARRRNS